MLTYGQIDTPDSFYGIICERVIPIRQLPGCGNLNQLVFVNTSVGSSAVAPAVWIICEYSSYSQHEAEEPT